MICCSLLTTNQVYYLQNRPGFGELCCLSSVWKPPRDKTNKVACAPSKDSDQPEHPPSLIRGFAVRMKRAWVLSYPLSAQRRLWSDWADAQADMSLRWEHRSFCWFCHEAAQMSRNRNTYFARACQPNGNKEKTFVHYHMIHDMTKPIKWVCVKRRLRSAWLSAQSDQSLRCALNW